MDDRLKGSVLVRCWATRKALALLHIYPTRLWTPFPLKKNILWFSVFWWWLWRCFLLSWDMVTATAIAHDPSHFHTHSHVLRHLIPSEWLSWMRPQPSGQKCFSKRRDAFLTTWVAEISAKLIHQLAVPGNLKAPVGMWWRRQVVVFLVFENLFSCFYCLYIKFYTLHFMMLWLWYGGYLGQVFPVKPILISVGLPSKMKVKWNIIIKKDVAACSFSSSARTQPLCIYTDRNYIIVHLHKNRCMIIVQRATRRR